MQERAFNSRLVAIVGTSILSNYLLLTGLRYSHSPPSPEHRQYSTFDNPITPYGLALGALALGLDAEMFLTRRRRACSQQR